MAAADVVIGPATPADLAGVAGIFAHYVTGSLVTFEETPPAVADWQHRLDDLAGPWRRQPAYRHTVEDSVYLAAGRTGQGLGRALLGPLLARCGQAGARQVVAVIADAGADSEASVALHRSFGFVYAGRLARVGHKHGRWIDTVLMQRDLPTMA